MIPELESSHEEADIRMWLNALYAYNNDPSSPITAVIDDTDGLILAIQAASKIKCPLYVMRGGKTTRIVDIHKLAAELGVVTCAAIVAFYLFTGCDYVSAFYGRGKNKPFKKMVNSPKFLVGTM